MGSIKAQAWNGRVGHRGWLVLGLGLFIEVCLLRPGFCEAPQTRVQATLEAVTSVLENPMLQGADKEAERRQHVRRIIFEAFDFPEMAREVLGGYWSKLTPEQRQEFTTLFGNLFERSYNRLVLRFLGERKTLYSTESMDQERALVQTIMVNRQEARLPVDYRLILQGGRWNIYDVVIEGVSLAMNYRAQFHKILRTSSYDTLVQRIRERLAEEP